MLNSDMVNRNPQIFAWRDSTTRREDNIKSYFFLLLNKVDFPKIRVAEPHHFYAAPAPGENFDAAPAPTLL
jgi:hypothetical protein